MDGAWWRDGVLYHIYVRSFCDSDGDGIGDLRGVISKLDHLAWLGVDGIWLSPVTPSPNEDWGYDVSDYTGVDPTLGTMDDYDRLVAEAGARGIRVLGDLVPNHSSDRHPWFVESRFSRTSAKRDWYLWADPASDGGPPNNWISNFFGPAWTQDEATGQVYLHSFLESQADLNWWNEDVRAAFDDVLRFWFDRGVAGFRIDVVHKLAKDRSLRDNPPAGDGDSFIERAFGQRELRTANLPETHEILRRWRRIADSYDPPRVLIGETYVLDLKTMATYHGRDDELNLTFNIPFLYAPFTADALRTVVEETEGALPEGAWPVWNGSSHDISRLASRWCGGDERKIRCALFLLLLLRGTPLLYYGDEIGMIDGPVRPEEALDPLARRVPGASAGRDPARTPMQWSADPGAGFTAPGVTPWLPFGDAQACNVAGQREDPSSTLTLCRDVIALRRGSGSAPTEFFDAEPGVLAWRRGNTTIALNLSDEPAAVGGQRGAIRIASERDRDGERIDGTLRLRPWEAAVIDPS